MINVLDTGAKNNGLDTLTVNGTDGNDVFLLRQVVVDRHSRRTSASSTRRRRPSSRCFTAP